MGIYLEMYVGFAENCCMNQTLASLCFSVEDLPSIVFPNDPSSASSSGPTSVGSNQKRSFCTSADQRVVPSGTNRKRVFHSVSKVNVGQKRPYHHLAGFQNGASDTVKKSKLLRVNCEHKRSMSSASSGNFDRECDYVIVGAGSAGCVLAHRYVLLGCVNVDLCFYIAGLLRTRTIQPCEHCATL